MARYDVTQVRRVANEVRRRVTLEAATAQEAVSLAVGLPDDRWTVDPDFSGDDHFAVEIAAYRAEYDDAGDVLAEDEAAPEA